MMSRPVTREDIMDVRDSQMDTRQFEWPMPYPFPDTIDVEVTEYDVRVGVQLNCLSCPLAIALGRCAPLAPGYSWISGTTHSQVVFDGEPFTLYYCHPANLRRAISRFDCGDGEARRGDGQFPGVFTLEREFDRQ